MAEERKNVLVVDDMALNLRTAKVMLDEFFNVFLAKSGELALKILEDMPIDLILLDIDMPGMSGFDFMEIFKKMPNVKDIPVIFVTSHVSSSFVSQASVVGARDYVAKPYDKTVLLKKMYTIIYGKDRFFITQEGKCIPLPLKKDAGDTAKSVKTVLAVDDMPTNLRTIKVILEDAYTVLVAKSGELALEILNERTVDLILLDIEMPAMSGFEVMEKIRQLPKASGVPVIFVTSHASEDLIRTAGDLGVADYIVKPILPETLKKKIAAVFAKYGPAEESYL
ncbi:MAG: response regulator [Treponema sp.]|nr:response regulator [Treponema sp.]